MNIALVSCNNLPGWEIDDQPLIDSLETKGVTVHRPAWDDDIDWEQFAISIIRTTWDYHEQKNAFVSWCKKTPRLCNNAEIVEWNTHKSYLKTLEDQGVPIAPTTWILKNESSDIEEIINQLQTDKGFIKPQVGACASDTFRFGETELKEAQRFLNANIHQDMMVQPYLTNVETEGELTAVFIEDTFTHGVRKVPVPGDYRVQDDFGASDMPHEFSTDEISQMKKVLKLVPAASELLYARFDYLRDNSGHLLLNELELVEPSLFFRHCRNSAEIFADAIVNRATMLAR